MRYISGTGKIIMIFRYLRGSYYYFAVVKFDDPTKTIDFYKIH